MIASAVVAVVGTLAVADVASAAPGDRSPDGVWIETETASRGADPGHYQFRRPDAFRTLELNDIDLVRVLAQAPLERSLDALAREVVLSLPLPEGGFARFRIEESPVLSPEIAASRPDLRTYAGQGVDNPTATVRFDRTPLGFHALLLRPGRMSVIEPLDRSGGSLYVTFENANVVREAGLVSCSILGESGGGPAREIAAPPSGAQLRTYDTGITATGEYTQFFGGFANAQAQIMTTINQINAIWEREVAISFDITCYNIFPDPATDAFPTPDVAQDGTLNTQNDASLDSACGENAYELGHLFHKRPSGYRGQALGRACAADKGRGVTTGVDPTTVIFTVDGVAHEIGHQFSAAHSYNGSDAGCSQRNASTAYEIGSGSTIMSYAIAGCTEDIPGSADSYFHTISFDQITDFREAGGNCAAATATGNTPPTVDAGPGFTIPRNTPFTLTADADDADGDALTYCWEQFDLGAASPPTEMTAGPLFRSLPPDPSAARTFPNLTDLLAGNPTPFEILPTADRKLNFRVTVRDNRGGGGGVNYDAVSIEVAGEPFAVLSPNGGELLRPDCPTTVTWQVGGGDVAPTVNVLYSADGGSNFVTVAAAVPNDGSEDVLLPCATTGQGRIRVEAVGNIFFDVSDDDFDVQAVAPTVAADATGGEVGADCTYLLPFSALVTDDCGVLAADVEVVIAVSTGNATLGVPDFVAQQVDPTTVQVDGTVLVSDLTSCPAVIDVTVTATDACDVEGTDTVVAEVTDTTPPSIAVTLNREFLWPPNHKLADIVATVEASDNCGAVSYVLTSVTSNEPENGLGDGDTAPDIVGAAIGTADVEFQLRSERSGKGSGRIYTIVYTATDACGNEAQDVAQVEVRHDQSAHALAFGLPADGATLDAPTGVFALVVTGDDPALAVESVDAPVVVGANGVRGAPPLRDGVSAPVRGVRAVDTRSAQLGNASAIVSAGASAYADWTGDGREDLVLLFRVADVRALGLDGSDPMDPVGLHFATRLRESFLVADILALGASAALPRDLPGFGSDVLATLGGDPEPVTAGPDAQRIGSIEPAAGTPRETRLVARGPGTAGAGVRLVLEVARTTPVRLDVFSIRGRFVRSMDAGVVPAGRHDLAWDGRDAGGRRAPAGMYVVRLSAGEIRSSAKALLLP
ncbi:MAG: reprolysin-like metallopeptidase [Candidatus Eiseniibacteriota bacterium]